MMIVIGSVEIRPEALEEAIELSREHVERSRTEPGCISHAVHQDCENPRRLVFVEEWADREALQTHFAVPESGAFVEALTELSAEPPLMAIYGAERLAP